MMLRGDDDDGDDSNDECRVLKGSSPLFAASTSTSFDGVSLRLICVRKLSPPRSPFLRSRSELGPVDGRGVLGLYIGISDTLKRSALVKVESLGWR